ncbi:uncharacterized protein LOC124806878 isoform X1 [Hydra vulgaris]|uniref:uncharacterized protein LOC124806878 isoform X1 n=1 Tax=Hydra vulgaris TaxID=6087 RepID=UPI001F5E7FA1|nr:uncharacterized protein LOC124806878 isoform X1 [Hydra vulgaris]
MTTLKNKCHRSLSFGIISFAIALSFSSLLTNHWFEELSRPLKVVYHKGLWIECYIFYVSKLNRTAFNSSMSAALNSSTGTEDIEIPEQSLCQKIENETRDEQIVRVLFILSICSLWLSLMTSLIVWIIKRSFNMDIVSVNVFFAICLKVGALSLYYEVNRAYSDFNYRYAMGFSYMLGWLSFSLLVIAITLAVLSRKNDERI